MKGLALGEVFPRKTANLMQCLLEDDSFGVAQLEKEDVPSSKDLAPILTHSQQVLPKLSQ